LDDNETNKSTEERAVEALLISVRTARRLLGQTLKGDRSIQHATGQNILREELGEFGDWKGTYYDLDEQTKNLLLAHTRQDSAHALVVANDCYELLYKINRTQRVHFYLFCAVIFFSVISGALYI